MNAKDADWPSLPPIRTSSYNARVSCETLNLHSSPPHTHPHAASGTTFTPDVAKPLSKSADATPLGTSSPSSQPRFFSSCFPHRRGKAHGTDGGKRGALDVAGLFRSMCGPVVPRYSTTTHRPAYAGGLSPPPSRTTLMPMSNSPSGRMKTPGTATSPMNVMRSGGSTPHSGALLRSSKGHAGHAFTMMPPDVVGKKKPPNYESDEPKSPEVTCIGKVRRKHCKATWDALIKEKQQDGKKKKGKIKRLSGEITRTSGEICRKSVDGDSNSNDCMPTVAAKLSKQRSERRRSHDLDSFSMEFDACVLKHGDSIEQDGHIRRPVMEQMNRDAPRHSFEGGGQDSLSDLKDSSEDMLPSGGDTKHNELLDDSSCDATVAVEPPSNCLLLMKKGSRNRSAHYAPDVEFAVQGNTRNQWTWGQVLT